MFTKLNHTDTSLQSELRKLESTETGSRNIWASQENSDQNPSFNLVISGKKHQIYKQYLKNEGTTIYTK